MAISMTNDLRNNNGLGRSHESLAATAYAGEEGVGMGNIGLSSIVYRVVW